MRFAAAAFVVVYVTSMAGAAPNLPDGALASFGRMPFHNGARIEAVDMSRDGKLLATLRRRSAIVYDTATGQPRHRFFFDIAPWPAYQRGLAFSPDGKRLACGPSSELVIVWDMATGKELRRFTTPFEMFGASLLRFSADGNALIVESDGVTSWLNVETGATIRELKRGRIRQLSADDRTFFAIENNQVLVGDTRTGKIRHTLPVLTSSNEHGLLPLPLDGDALAVVHHALGDTTEVQFWNIKTGKRELRTWQLPKSDVGVWRRLAVSPDGKVLYSTLRRFALETNKELPPIPLGWTQAVFAHPDGKTLFAVGLDEIRRWDLSTGKQISTDEEFITWRHSALSSDGRWLALRGYQNALELCDTQTHQTKRIDHPWGNGATLAFAADSKMLFVNAYYHLDGLSVPQLAQVKKFKPAKDSIDEATIHVSPDGRHIATLSSTANLRVFELASMKELWQDKQVGRAAFTLDGRSLLIHSRLDRSLRLVDVATRNILFLVDTPHDLEGRRGGPWISAWAFSPDGRVLALAMSGGQICLLDAATGKERARFLSMPSPEAYKSDRRGYNHATAVAFSPNGQWLAAGGIDGYLRLWDVSTRRELHLLHGHEGATQALGFSADGRRLTSFGDHEGFVWDLRPNSSAKSRNAFADLLSDDGATTYRAVWTLAKDAQAPALLREKFAPQRVDIAPERIAQWIADLDSPRFTVRQTAMQSLAASEKNAASALSAALKKGPSLETRRRIEDLLDALDADPEPQARRVLRSVHALELHGSDAARRVLREWAEGTSGLRLTDAARAAGERLNSAN